MNPRRLNRSIAKDDSNQWLEYRVRQRRSRYLRLCSIARFRVCLENCEDAGYFKQARAEAGTEVVAA